MVILTKKMVRYPQNMEPLPHNWQKKNCFLFTNAELTAFYIFLQVVGSSLLFVHDWMGRTGVWMIDFGKTASLPPDLTLDHRTPWVEGNREDGYLWGLDNLIDILANMLPLTWPPVKTCGNVLLSPAVWKEWLQVQRWLCLGEKDSKTNSAWRRKNKKTTTTHCTQCVLKQILSQ